MTDKDIVLKNLAKKYGISMAQARDIEDSLSFVAYIMVNKSDRSIPYFPSVRIASFGLFHCPENYRLKLKDLNNKDNESI
jgi:hypothetical protein